jgi:translation initiation factor 3 subunit A
VELAVSLRMNIKEGLHQFRSLCQLNTQFNALESVLRFYVKESEQMLIQAGAKAGQQALESVADLDEEDAPEMLLQRLTSGSEQRSDRELLTPCLKYVWETFRCTLDLLKNNARMDDLYQVCISSTFFVFFLCLWFLVPMCP